MNYLLIAISAALGACLLGLVALLASLSRRSSQRADARVDDVVRVLEQRMDELARELTGTLERAEEETRRSSFLAEIAGSIDLDDVLARTLEAAAALPGIDAAIVRLESTPKPIVAAHGVSVEEAERQRLAGPPGGGPATAVELTYRYPDETEGEPVRAGLAVPLTDDGAPVGWLALYSRGPEHRFDQDDVRLLEQLAARAAPAIENARRFREARRLADLDALTGLHNRRYFHETLAREVARAHRYGRRLALVVFDLDDFKQINDRIGHLAGDAVLAEAAERVREVVRSADIACRIGGDEFAVIVPESGIEQAQQLVVRIQRSVASRPVAQAGRLRLSAGVAELQPQDDAVALFERADAELYGAKEQKDTGGPTSLERPA
ncbi:MAG TPA: sensor domain-containing diguanylate cyclase [Gaiellaceae bacterium]|jgi:diguanylate cyclase (GGDEF)-like protein|nr:sensor domain-containing diguanylate cyclase [Gaiellaceae bacterium]